MNDDDLTDRDIFALVALAGLTANPRHYEQLQNMCRGESVSMSELQARSAYRIADAMLKERANAPKTER